MKKTTKVEGCCCLGDSGEWVGVQSAQKVVVAQKEPEGSCPLSYGNTRPHVKPLLLSQDSCQMIAPLSRFEQSAFEGDIELVHVFNQSIRQCNSYRMIPHLLDVVWCRMEPKATGQYVGDRQVGRDVVQSSGNLVEVVGSQILRRYQEFRICNKLKHNQTCILVNAPDSITP